MDFEKSTFVKLMTENHGDLDPLNRATEILLKTIVKKKFKGNLNFLKKFKLNKIFDKIGGEDNDDDKAENENESKKVSNQLPPFSRYYLI
jgi:hypothetical protein